MKKISCCGYHATGSGAVDDYLREFNNISLARYGVECRFLQDPDGISDLAFNLVENTHRLNAGFALKRYMNFVKYEKRTYRHIFGEKWYEYSKDYLDSLTEFEYKGYWHGDIRLISSLELFVYKTRRFINLLMPKSIRKNKYYSYFPHIKTPCVCTDRDEFIDKTRKYVNRLCDLLNADNREYVVLDQVASAQNPMRYIEYVDDLKVVIVDRDPRDVYMNDIIKNKDFVLPVDVHEFCEIYKKSRITVGEKEDPKLVLRLNFEDMIYHYDETTEKVKEFLGLSEEQHKDKFKHFDPKVSIANTKIWEKKSGYEKEIQVIEQELKDYLYF